MPRPTALQIDLRQTRPFRGVAHEAAVGLLHTASVVERFLARVVEPSGVSLAQYNVLRILRGAGPEGHPTLAIRDRMIAEATGITRLLDKLEAVGLVRRERTLPDRRQVRCFITRAGLRLLRSLDSAVDQADAAAVGGLTASEQRELIALMNKVRAQHRSASADAG